MTTAVPSINLAVHDCRKYFLVFVMKDNPYGHPDIVLTRPAKDLGIEDAEDDACFVRVVPESEEKTELIKKNLFPSENALSYSDIIHYLKNGNNSLKQKNKKCLGVFCEKDDQIRTLFFPPNDLNVLVEERKIPLYNNLCELLEFFGKQGAIIDAKIIWFSNNIKRFSGIRVEVITKVTKAGTEKALIKSSDDPREIMTALWQDMYAEFACKDGDTLSRFFFTRLYVAAQARMKIWDQWKKDHPW